MGRGVRGEEKHQVAVALLRQMEMCGGSRNVRENEMVASRLGR